MGFQDLQGPFCGRGTFTLVLTLAVFFASSQAGRIVLVGNGIKPSSSGVDVPGATFLLNDLILQEGVVFAFSCYFRADNPVRLQIWRPTQNRSLTEFTLVHELRVIPSVINAREDIYMEALLTAPCPVVQTGDRLGMYMEEVPGSVAYTFDASTPMALGHTVSNLSDPTAINTSVAFDTLTFPYDFSMSAFIDTKFNDGRVYNPKTGCPKGLLIPEYGPNAATNTTLPPPVTGAPGRQGPPGPRGSAGAAGPRGAVGPAGAAGPAGPAGPPGPLADTQGATGAMGPAGPEGPMGLNGTRGAVGATGVQGPVGRNGWNGTAGSVGATGARGLAGPPGPPGPPGPLATAGPREANQAASLLSVSMWSDPTMVMILVIWLAILSAILLIVAIIACCRCCRRNRKRRDPGNAYRASTKSAFDPAAKDDFQYVGTGSGTGTAETPAKNGLQRLQSDPKPEWMNSMREDTFKDYCIDTIERDPSRKRPLNSVTSTPAHNNNGSSSPSAFDAQLESPTTTNATSGVADLSQITIAGEEPTIVVDPQGLRYDE